MKKFFEELIATFSNDLSYLSSKRIERFSVFAVMLAASAAWLFRGVSKCNIGASDLMIVVGGWLAYAGFNIVQGRKDVNKNNE